MNPPPINPQPCSGNFKIVRTMRSAVAISASYALLAWAGFCAAQSNEAAHVASPPVVVSKSSAAISLDAIKTQTFDWQDNVRNRAVPVRLYLPDAISTNAKPVPLIVFSHGLGGSRNGYQYLGRYWASQGYASLHVQHIGSDNTLWRGNPFGLTFRLTEAAKDTEAIGRANDVSFALTELFNLPELAGRIDANRIVAAGHSYGANTTMLLSGAAVPRRGEKGNEILNLRDPRIKAAMLLSAPPFYGYGNPAAILGAIALPSLHITATGDDIVVPGYGSGVDDRVSVFNAMGDARKTLVVFTGGSHSIFTDRTTSGGIELNPKVKAATQELSLAFLKRIFNDDTAALADWQPKFADLLARFVPGK
jgi:dienelactone hydrolase